MEQFDKKKEEYNKFITKGKETFLGSQPIQIQKSKFFRLLDLNMVVTPKIDGVRYLLYCGKDYLCFVNRSLKHFRVRDQSVKTKYKDNISLLVDVEVVEKDNKLHVFLFDFLFLKKGDSDSIQVYRKPYIERMALLRKQKGIFDHYSSDKVEFYYKTFLEYNSLVSYEHVCKLWEERMGISSIDYDGLIFINKYSRYRFDLSYGQYKWKPQDKLSIDLLYQDNKLFDSNGKTYTLPKGLKKKLKNNKVYEFSYGETLKLLKEEPREKKENSTMTIESVKEAWSNPVKVEDILPARSKMDESWLTKDNALKLLFLYGYKELGYLKEVENPFDWYQKNCVIGVSDFERKMEQGVKLEESGVISLEDWFNNISIEPSDKVKCEVFLNIGKEYDSGFKKVKNKTAEKLIKMKRNIGDKLQDADYLVRKFKWNNNMIPIREENINEYWYKSKKKIYVYHLDKKNDKETLVEIIKNVKENSTTLMENCHFWVYGVDLMFRKKTISSGTEIEKEKQQPPKDYDLLREKKIYVYRLDSITLLKIVFMTEVKGGNQRKKAFIELHYNNVLCDNINGWVKYHVLELFKQLI